MHTCSHEGVLLFSKWSDSDIRVAPSDSSNSKRLRDMKEIKKWPSIPLSLPPFPSLFFIIASATWCCGWWVAPQKQQVSREAGRGFPDLKQLWTTLFNGIYAIIVPHETRRNGCSTVHLRFHHSCYD